ncbi:mannose-1-phosphate guanylyltransferase/mannose-6-phosphate isomerase [Gammaproteobacteria bacterium]|nr:mannose-1-phosphate guanylyltransferase/mannose-6-phosphate isomerase [Gammaproteobacteria bacterium]
MNICPVILAGGTGSRLWPLSRASHPKQFLSLLGDNTMLQATVKRLDELNIQSSVTICNEEHRFFVAEQLREINKLGTIILEPVGKNTAPAIALAALSLKDDPLILVLAADHVIQNESGFTKAISDAIPLAESGKLVTFGVVPKEPHSGYGYIKRGRKEGVGFAVDKFVEKPTFDIAKEYLTSGEYYWNSGMFLFKASRYLEELQKFRSDIFDICKVSVESLESDLDFLRIPKEKFSECPSESIDYAIMEKTEDAVVVPMDARWSDIGSWSSLWHASKKDDNGNVSDGDVLMHKTNNSFVKSDDEKVITTIGIDDLIVISTKDAVLVAHKNSAQDIKIITQMLRDENRTEWDLNREVYRPWGKYDSIANHNRYQVKKLTVNPGAKLSVQMHYHRSEHWVVVAGLARVHYSEESFEIGVNESTYHGKEVVHALENPGDIPLELIEVQVGDYLGEDDIVRFEDKYGRL